MQQILFTFFDFLLINLHFPSASSYLFYLLLVIFRSNMMIVFNFTFEKLMPLPQYQPNDKHNLSAISSIIAIAAGKGGVGKSTVTVNLARTLVSLGYSVGVLDADIYGPSLRRMLPEDRLPSQKGETIYPALAEGVKYISMAYFRKDNEAAVVRAPIANGVINQFISGVAWGALDFLLIDFPPGTGDIQLTLAQKAFLSGALLVTTPQEVAVLDVRKAAKMFDQVKIPVIGVLENMSYYTEGNEKTYLFGRGGGERLARELGVPLLGQIPVDKVISDYGDSGKPFLLDSEQYKIFNALAKEMIRHLNALKKEQSDVLAIETVNIDSPNYLEIEWKGGECQCWSASELQKNCPCANCVDEKTGKRRISALPVCEDSQIKKINRVGRYAIQIEFIKGCSIGIYDFDYLRSLPTSAVQYDK